MRKFKTGKCVALKGKPVKSNTLYKSGIGAKPVVKQHLPFPIQRIVFLAQINIGRNTAHGRLILLLQLLTSTALSKMLAINIPSLQLQNR